MEASVATPGQGAPDGGAQPAAAGQGAPQGQPTAAGKGDAGFNWGLFPDVPVEQQELLEPHLKNVQSHVTKMESQYAPYKGLTEAVSPDQVEGLVSFLSQYQSDPVSVALGVLAEQVEQGNIPKGAVEAVQGLMQQQQGQPADQGAQPAQEGEQIPEWAQQLQARLDAAEQAEQEAEVQRQEQEGQQMLEQAKTGIRGTLTEAGVNPEQVPDEMIVAAIIANNGDEGLAAQQLTQMRQAFLADFANGKTQPGGKPTVQGDLPAAKKGSQRPASRNDLGVDKNAAQQFLEQAAQANS